MPFVGSKRQTQQRRNLVADLPVSDPRGVSAVVRSRRTAEPHLGLIDLAAASKDQRLDSPIKSVSTVATRHRPLYGPFGPLPVAKPKVHHS